MIPVRRLLADLVDFLYPPSCFACRTNTRIDGLCLSCAGQLRPVRAPQCNICGLPYASQADTSRPCARCLAKTPSYRSARSCLIYDTTSPLAALIRRFKYDRDVGLAPILASLLLRHLPALYPFDLILPVPLHRERLGWRGFNQAVLLGRRLSRHTRKPLLLRSLVRQRATRPQVELGEADRLHNVRDAFAVSDPDLVDRRRILLIDDVFTTGATVDECARTLRRAGAIQVDVLTLARTGIA